MTSQWKYRISVRAVILSLSSYFVFPIVKPGDRLKVGGRVWFSVPDDLSLEEFTTFCSSFSAGADKRSTTSVSTAKRLADDATCEPTSCASSSFGAAKRSYTLTTSSICGNGRCAFWISNRDRQKPGGPLLGRLGRDATGRVRRSARVHANSGSAQALSAHGRTGAGRERLAVHGGSAAGPESIETCSRSCSIKGWRGPYNGEEWR